MDKRLRVGIGFSIAFAILLLFLAVYPDAASKQWALNLLLCLFGSLLGWFAGFMAAPYDNEKDAFLSIGKAITAFLSGYFVSKFNMVFDSIFQEKLFLNVIFITENMLFFCSFLLTFITVFIVRRYMNP